MVHLIDEVTWNKGVLTGGCILLGTILGAAIDGALFYPGATSTYLQQWQTLVGAILALGGIVVAYKNVTRQISAQQERATLDVFSREETRIEAVLPGIKEARVLIGMILFGYRKYKDDLDDLAGHLKDYGFTTFSEVESAEEVAKALPNSDGAIRQRVRHRMRIVVAAIESLRQAKSRGDSEREAKLTSMLSEMFEGFQEFRAELESLIKKYEARQANLRRRIEKYFDD